MIAHIGGYILKTTELYTSHGWIIWFCCCSVTKSCPVLWESNDCSTSVSSVLHYLSELLKFMSIELVMLINHLIVSPPSPFAFDLSQHQGLFQWVSSSHQVAKVLELQHQSFQYTIVSKLAVPFSRGSSNPGIKPRFPTLQADSLPAEQGKPFRSGLTINMTNFLKTLRLWSLR